MLAVVDDEDYERVSQFNWIYQKNTNTSFTISTKIKVNEKIKNVMLGRFILGISKGIVWNINRNHLDFTRNNLKIVDRKFLSQMSRGRRNSSSKYKGVSWNKREKCWVVQIQDSHLNINIRERCESEDKAALLYNELVKGLYGDDCYLNVIGQDNLSKDIPKELPDVNYRTVKKKKYKGVIKDKNGKFISKIYVDGKDLYLGCFQNEKIAAKVYDKKAIELFGEKARLNFPEGR